MNIGRADLNLLVYLDVLLRERNVTRAAHQLWVCSTGTPSLLLPEALVRASG